MIPRTGNRLLDLLRETPLRQLISRSQLVPLLRGQQLFRQEEPVPFVYFPVTSVLAIVLLGNDGQQVDIATVGGEGMAGLPQFLGVDFHLYTCVVQVAGQAWRVPAASFQTVVRESPELDWVMRRYTLFRLAFASQIGACNCFHVAEERLARWLLMAHDRAGRDEFPVTHELLSELLGLRRQTVSLTAGTLQRAGLISYRRGVLRVLYREGLEHVSCECYEILKQLYDRLIC